MEAIAAEGRHEARHQVQLRAIEVLTRRLETAGQPVIRAPELLAQLRQRARPCPTSWEEVRKLRSLRYWRCIGRNP